MGLHSGLHSTVAPPTFKGSWFHGLQMASRDTPDTCRLTGGWPIPAAAVFQRPPGSLYAQMRKDHPTTAPLDLGSMGYSGEESVYVPWKAKKDAF